MLGFTISIIFLRILRYALISNRLAYLSEIFVSKYSSGSALAKLEPRFCAKIIKSVFFPSAYFFRYYGPLLFLFSKCLPDLLNLQGIIWQNGAQFSSWFHFFPHGFALVWIYALCWIWPASFWVLLHTLDRQTQRYKH